ncbi:hypothetical protein Y032_0042g662 [Ancylostoma ceylanicum]|uniref:Uncharacterized protein n=1 Tax=Ancylostoma ceylanicum TaxID=53326 RepID=A0A016UFC3_9BILA|nr:hypothetical protein Y032_0042g662 [Ancylostoma ceylanicum]
MYLDLSSYLLRKHFSRPVGYSQVFLQLCSQSMVRVYLDPLVNLTSVASILWVAGRCYGVVILVSAEKVETGRTLHGSIAVTRAFSSTKIRFLEEMVRTLTVVAIVLNLMSNAMKFFDSRYLWSFTFPSFVFLQLILIICEALILYMTATLSTDSAALSFLVDVGYIAFLIVFMETTCYIMHRTIRTEEYDAMKKNV